MNNYIITSKNQMDKVPIECMPERADFAFVFICYAEIDGKKGLLTYDYNPAWQQWYPFYDDVNKKAVLHKFSGKTFADLINEHEKVMPIDVKYRLQKACERFGEIFATSFDFKPIKKEPYVYELKYSKSQNLWTLYKIFNFIITEVKELRKLLQPKGMKWKLIDINQIAGSDLVTNVAEIYSQIKKEVESSIILI